MIEITRNFARPLRSIIRRALHVTPSAQPAIVFEAGPAGLLVQARNHEVAIQYHRPGECPSDRIVVPYDLLADCEGRKEEPIELTGEKTRVLASWRDGAVQQVIRYQAPRAKDEPFPPEPSNLVANDPSLWQALHDAGQIADETTSRYATACLQLRSSGRIAATDGRRGLVQDGFSFPWEGDVLVRANKLFGCRELDLDSVSVGGGQDGVSMRLGSWTLHLAIDKHAKFPRLEDVLRRPEDATTRWALSPSDSQFVLENLPKLLVAEEEVASSVTIDLGSQAILRTKASNDTPVKELLLTASPPSGAPLRISTPLDSLLVALRLGLRELSFYGADTILIGRDERRTYCWMPVAPESVLAPCADAMRIESPSAGKVPVIITSTQRTTMPKPKNPTNCNATTNGHASTNGHTPPPVASDDETQPTEAAATTDALAEALALKQTLQEAVGKTSALIAALRRQTRQSRLLRSTLQSLRELQHVSG